MRELVDLYFRQAAEIMAGLDKAVKDGASGRGRIIWPTNWPAPAWRAACRPWCRRCARLEQGARGGHLDGADGLFAANRSRSLKSSAAACRIICASFQPRESLG